MSDHSRRYCVALLFSTIALSMLVGCSSSDSTPTGPPADATAPAAVTDLRAIAGTDSSITFTWIATGDDAHTGTAEAYDFRYTLLADSADDWSMWHQTDNEPLPGPAGTAETMLLSGLTQGAEYAAQLRVSDESDNQSTASNIALAAAATQYDITPPEAVSDLDRWASDDNSVTVYWSAPGDDEDYGTAAEYDLRYSTSAINEGNWAGATQATGLPAPQAPGTRETATIPGLTEDELYHFALKSVDEAGNWSALSTLLSVRTVDMHTWYVKVDGSGDAPTIRAACVDSASVGDVILVAPGTYSWSNQGDGDEDYGMIFFARDVTGFELRSEAGAEQTIIDAEGQGRVFMLQGITSGNTNNITIDGFTITGGNSLASAIQDSSGGGLTAHLCSPTIRNCIFRGNESVWGGGLWYGGVGAPLIEDCLFEDNHGGDYGGGIFLINSYNRPRITGCTFRNNEAGMAGGGVFAYNIVFTIAECLFVDNNSHDKGGGLSVLNIHPSHVRDCTFVGNYAVVAGGGIRMSGECELNVTRTIVAFNTHGGGLSLNNNGPTMDLSCSNIFGNVGGDELPAGTTNSGGNMNLDPLFCSMNGENAFRLQSDSPCVDGNYPNMTCGNIGVFGVGCAGD